MNAITSNNQNDAQGAYPEQGRLSTDHDKQTTLNQDTAFEETISAPNKGGAQESKNNMPETTNGDQSHLALEYKVPTLFGRPPTPQAIQAYKDAINESFRGPGSFKTISSQLEGVRCLFTKKGFSKEFAIVDSLATAENVCGVSRTAIVIIHEPGSHKLLNTDAQRVPISEIPNDAFKRLVRGDVYLFRNMRLIKLHTDGCMNVIWRTS